MNRDNNRDRAPLWFRYAYKAATAPRRVKIGVIALATAAAAISYIYFLQADADKNKTTAEASARITPADNVISEARMHAAYTAIGQEPPENLMTPVSDIQPPTEYAADAVPAPSEETAEENPDKVPGWIILALAVLGALGVRRVVDWTEKEGYDMKRFEDWANRNSKKRKDDPEP